MERVYRSAEPNEDQMHRMVSNLVAVTGHGIVTHSTMHYKFNGEIAFRGLMHWGNGECETFDSWRGLQDKYFEIVRCK